MTDLVKLYEARVLTNIRLTQHQKEILAMVVAAPEGIVPGEDISKDRNYATARQLLTKLGLLEKDGDDKYSVSEAGQKVAKDENIIDDSGQLTELGNKLAYKDKGEDATDSQPPAAGADMGPTDMPPAGPFANTAPAAADVESYKFGFGKFLAEGAEHPKHIATRHSGFTGMWMFRGHAIEEIVDQNDNSHWDIFTPEQVEKGEHASGFATDSTKTLDDAKRLVNSWIKEKKSS